MIFVGVVGNISSVVGIVIMNKYITEVDGFNFMVFLSFLHFLTTTIGLQLMLMCNMFTKPKAPFGSVVPVAIGSLMSVAFMNLNLSHNSVGFYQVCNPLHVIYTVVAIFICHRLNCVKHLLS